MKYYDFIFSYTPCGVHSFLPFFVKILKDQAKAFAPKDSKQSKYRYGVYEEISNADKNSLHFVIQSDQQDAVLHFADALSVHLPLSLHFVFSEIKVLLELESLKPLQVKALTKKTHYCTPNEIRAFLSEQHFGDVSVFAYAKKLQHTKNLSAFIKQIFKQLQDDKASKPILLQSARGLKELSLEPFDEPSECIVCDISSLQTLFRIQNVECELMASFEKPSMRLAPKAVFAKQFVLDEFGLVLCTLPYDCVLQLLSVLMVQKERTHFFIRDCKKSRTSKESSIDFKHSKQHQKIITASENGLFIDTAIARDRSLLELFSHNIPTDCKTLIFYLSSRHKSAILLREPHIALGEKGSLKEIMIPRFECNITKILHDIASNYESGETLVQNFKQKVSLQCIKHLDSKQSVMSENFIHIFGIAALLLEMSDEVPNENNLLAVLSRTSKNLIANANEFVHQKGPRIDYHLLRDGNALRLDYPRIFRSSMSFKCAGMENAILAYGFIDSFCEFLATMVRDMQVNYAFGEDFGVLLCGDMFAHKIFFTRLLNFLPKNISLLLPKDGFLDRV